MAGAPADWAAAQIAVAVLTALIAVLTALIAALTAVGVANNRAVHWLRSQALENPADALIATRLRTAARTATALRAAIALVTLVAVLTASTLA